MHTLVPWDRICRDLTWAMSHVLRGPGGGGIHLLFSIYLNFQGLWHCICVTLHCGHITFWLPTIKNPFRLGTSRWTGLISSEGPWFNHTFRVPLIRSSCTFTGSRGWRLGHIWRLLFCLPPRKQTIVENSRNTSDSRVGVTSRFIIPALETFAFLRDWQWSRQIEIQCLPALG